MALPPIKILKCNVTTVTPQANWPADSSSYAGAPYRWTVTLTVEAQGHSDPTTTTPYYYNGADIAVGDWMSNAVGGFAWQIKSISAQTATAVTCVIEDVDQFNTYSDANGNGDGSPAAHQQGFIYSLVSSGQPTLSPVIPNILTPQWQTDLIGRYTYVNPGSSQSLPTLTVSDATVNFNVGPAVAEITGTTTVNGAPTLDFGANTLFTPAVNKTVHLANTGESVLNVASIIATGDYSVVTSPIPTTVQPADTVDIIVGFTPTVNGTRTGTLTFNTDAASSPDVVNLTGTSSGSATAAHLSLSVSTITFSGVTTTGTTATAQTVTMTNTGQSPLIFSSATISGTNASDFAITNSSLPSQIAGSGTFDLHVSFTPSINGAETATLTITTNSSTSPDTVALSGTGGMSWLSTQGNKIILG
jgi:hypothetical protein